MAIMANGRVSPGSKYVDWDKKYHQRQTKHFHFFYLTEECVRANMHYLYIDWAVKPELQTNINTSLNQIMHQSFTPLPPPPPGIFLAILGRGPRAFQIGKISVVNHFFGKFSKQTRTAFLVSLKTKLAITHTIAIKLKEKRMQF